MISRRYCILNLLRSRFDKILRESLKCQNSIFYRFHPTLK